MDTHNLSYQLFLAEQMYEQSELEMFINECVLIGEGTNTLTNIDIIHESFVDKIKESIKKFLQAIANMWHKFTEAMNTLLKTDRAYLEKYKDIILKKNPIECEYTMYKYDQGLPLLLKSQIPVLNLNNMDAELADDETFLRKYFATFIQGAKTPYNIGDLARAKFRGGNEQEVDIKSTQLNMTDLYNYCYDYKKFEDLIQKDIKNIQDSAGSIIIKIDKMVRDGQIKNEAAALFESAQYLSTVYNTFVNEATPGTRVKPEDSKNNNTNNGNNNNSNNNNGTNNANNNGSGNGSNNGSNNNSSGNNNNNNPVQNKPSQAYNKTDNIDKNQEINVEKTAKELTAKANRYLKICGEFLGAKQSIAEEIYKAYMSIIRAHVRDHVGKKSEAKDNKSADRATDYNNMSNSDKEQVEKALGSKKLNNDDREKLMQDINKALDDKNKSVQDFINYLNNNDEDTILKNNPSQWNNQTKNNDNNDQSNNGDSDLKNFIKDIFNKKPNK